MDFLKKAFGHHNEDAGNSAKVSAEEQTSKPSTLSSSELQETSENFHSQNKISDDSLAAYDRKPSGKSEPIDKTEGYDQELTYGEDGDEDIVTKEKPSKNINQGLEYSKDEDSELPVKSTYGEDSYGKPVTHNSHRTTSSDSPEDSEPEVKTSDYDQASTYGRDDEDSDMKKPMNSSTYVQDSEYSSYEDSEKRVNTSQMYADSEYSDQESAYRKHVGQQGGDQPSYKDSESSFVGTVKHVRNSQEGAAEELFQDSESSFKPFTASTYEDSEDMPLKRNSGGNVESVYDETPVTTYQSYAQEEEVTYGKTSTLDDESVPTRSSPHGHQPSQRRPSKLSSNEPESQEDAESKLSSYSRTSVNNEDSSGGDY